MSVMVYLPSFDSMCMTVFSTYLPSFVPPSLRVSFWCFTPTSSIEIYTHSSGLISVSSISFWFFILSQSSFPSLYLSIVSWNASSFVSIPEPARETGFLAFTETSSGDSTTPAADTPGTFCKISDAA